MIFDPAQGVAEIATEPSPNAPALAMEHEERAHVALVKAWITKVPQPGGD